MKVWRPQRLCVAASALQNAITLTAPSVACVWWHLRDLGFVGRVCDLFVITDLRGRGGRAGAESETQTDERPSLLCTHCFASALSSRFASHSLNIGHSCGWFHNHIAYCIYLAVLFSCESRAESCSRMRHAHGSNYIVLDCIAFLDVNSIVITHPSRAWASAGTVPCV